MAFAEITWPLRRLDLRDAHVASVLQFKNLDKSIQAAEQILRRSVPWRSNFLRNTRRHGGACFVAPLDIVLSEYNVVQPDVVYFGPETLARLDPLEYVRVRPDAAFEVLSPSTARNDRGRKRTLMERFGVREYWVIDPRGRSL